MPKFETKISWVEGAVAPIEVAIIRHRVCRSCTARGWRCEGGCDRCPFAVAADVVRDALRSANATAPAAAPADAAAPAATPADAAAPATTPAEGEKIKVWYDLIKDPTHQDGGQWGHCTAEKAAATLDAKQAAACYAKWGVAPKKAWHIVLHYKNGRIRVVRNVASFSDEQGDIALFDLKYNNYYILKKV